MFSAAVSGGEIVEFALITCTRKRPGARLYVSEGPPPHSDISELALLVDPQGLKSARQHVLDVFDFSLRHLGP